MKIKELFQHFIDQGIKKDPRGQDKVKKLLSSNNDAYSKLPADEKECYDVENLTNPYADSRILHSSEDIDIKSILVGIDIETPELLLAQTLRSQGKKIDLVLTHHPEGMAYATFYEVMGMQADILNNFGVPINIAESLTDKRQKEVGRKVMPQNHFRSVDTARILDIPFMGTHTIADNHVSEYLQSLFDESKPEHVGDVLKILKGIPEYKTACLNGTGPVILEGSKENRAGRIFVDMTGGTEGSKDVLEKLAAAGVGTIVGMHMSEDHLKSAEKHHIHVVIAGHISSDNLGMNLMLDSAEKQFGSLEIFECSGFRRIKRDGK